MRKTFFVFFLLVLAVPVWAAEQYDQPPCNVAYQAADRARQNEIRLAADQYAQVQQAQRPLTGSDGQSAGCLDKFKDINIAGGLGLPNVSQIFDGLLQSATTAVCNSVDSAYTSVARQASADVILPGGIAGARVNLPTASQIPATAQQPIRVTTTNPPVVQDAQRSITDRIRDQVRGLLQ